jgi:aminoglycoside phosphotransferase (APT) family kinase protein
MTRSAHAYVRGSTVSFYEWLESSRRVKLPEGPSVWICGDCHVGNLGPLADTKGHVLVQIRDLDQTVIGNPAHDLALNFTKSLLAFCETSAISRYRVTWSALLLTMSFNFSRAKYWYAIVSIRDHALCCLSEGWARL